MSLRPTTSLLLLSGLIFSLSACVKRDRDPQLESESAKLATLKQSPSTTQSKRQPININTAPANELETLPGIGKGLAERIIEHREKHGPFRRPEHLIIVRGISDKRFRALRDLITVD